MLVTFALVATLAQPIDYQRQVYTTTPNEEGVQSGILDAAQTACLEANIPANVKRVALRRRTENFGELCLVTDAFVPTPIVDFVALDPEPEAAFSADGLTAFVRTPITDCKARGQWTALLACLPYSPALGALTEVSLNKSDSGWILLEVWERVSANANRYGQDRAARKARSKDREKLPEPEAAPLALPKIKSNKP